MLKYTFTITISYVQSTKLRNVLKPNMAITPLDIIVYKYWILKDTCQEHLYSILKENFNFWSLMFSLTCMYIISFSLYFFLCISIFFWTTVYFCLLCVFCYRPFFVFSVFSVQAKKKKSTLSCWGATVVLLWWGGLLGPQQCLDGWCQSSGIHMNTSTQGFPA